MTIEKLKEARKVMEGFGWYASCDGGDSVYYQAIGDIAIELIDAEIERIKVED